jgi:hypothetical protein
VTSAFWGQSFVGQLTSIADQAQKKEDLIVAKSKEDLVVAKSS